CAPLPHSSTTDSASARSFGDEHTSALMVSFALNGVGVSGGIAIGRAQLVSHATLEVAHYTIPASKVDAEIARFTNAIKEVQRELEGLHAAMTGGDVPGEFG